MTDRSPAVDPAAILKEADALRDFMVDLTLRISRERTVNYFQEDYPQGGPDGMDMPGHESRVVEILRKELDAIGVPHKTYAKVKDRENLLASVGQGKPGYKKLLVVLHTDVVPAGAPSDWKFAPFEPFEKDGKLYGRGVLDDKGPLAACFAVLKILKEHEDQVPGEFIFGAMADEEVGVGVGLDYLIDEEKVIECTDAIIPDIAGEMREINIAEKGRVILKVRSKGKQAHAMEPSKGINAVYAMAHFLQQMEKHELGHEKHSLLGGPTVNLGLIRGGAAPNAVAADCEATLDIRYVPSQSAEKIRQEVQALAEKSQAGGATPGAKFETEIFANQLPSEVAPDAPIVRNILKHAPGAKLTGSGGGTFAKDLILMGVEAVGWSCGAEETYHQPNEEIEISQITTYAGRLANLAFDLCNMEA